MHGHTIERCYKLHGYPPGYNKGNKSTDAAANQVLSNEEKPNANEEAHTILPQLSVIQYQQLLNLLASQQTSVSLTDPIGQTGNTGMILTCTPFNFQSDTWILDSGATRHICTNMKLFQSIMHVIPTKLILPNNEVLVICQSGTVCITDDIILENVLYVPNFKFNILSMSCLINTNNFQVSFYSDEF